MTQIDTMGPAQAFLGGANAGLQLRGQMQQADQFRANQAQQASQFDARMAQDQSQFGATFGLNTDIFNAREERARMELERELRRARLRADHARGGLAPRGGLPIPGNGSIIFTPPGEDDDFHAMLDEAGDDPELMDEMAQTVLKGADARMSLRSYLANLQREGLSEYADPNGKMGKVVAAWKNSTNPRTIEMAMKMADEMEGRNQAIKAGASLGIPPEIAVNMTPAQLWTASRDAAKAKAGDAEIQRLAADMSAQFKIPMEEALRRVRLTKGNVINEGQNQTAGTRQTVDSLIKQRDQLVKLSKDGDVPTAFGERPDVKAKIAELDEQIGELMVGPRPTRPGWYHVTSAPGDGGTEHVFGGPNGVREYVKDDDIPEDLRGLVGKRSTTPIPGVPTQASSAAVPNEDDDARALAAFRQKFGRDPADDAEFEQFIGGGGL